MITIADAVFRAFGRDVPSGPLGDEFYQQAARQTGWLQRFKANIPGGVNPTIVNPVIIVGLSVVDRVLEYRWPLSQAEVQDVDSLCGLIRPAPSGLSGRLRLRVLVTGRPEGRPVPNPQTWAEVGWKAPDPLPNEYWAQSRLEDAVNPALAARRQGAHYRILFPTFRKSPEPKNAEEELTIAKEPGQLVWAEVTVCPPLNRERPSAARLLLAPWTFFLPDEEGERSWKDLCDAFPKALTHLQPCPTEPRDYLVSLHPVGPEELPCGTVRQRFDAATALAPHGVRIGGPSLGVAVALAAHAAAMNRRVRPIIATGIIQGKGEVSKVGGAEQKLRAWKLFREGLEPEDAPLFLYPEENDSAVRKEARGLGLDDAHQSRILFPLQSLADLEPDPKTLRDFFTDGFDGYRTRVLHQKWPGPPSGELEEQCKDLSPILAALYSRVTRWTPDTATNAWQREVPASDRGSMDDPWLYKITGWFDEKPQEPALEVFRRLAETWTPRITLQPGQCYDDPVVLCVRAVDLMGDGELPPRLARAVRMSCENWPGPTASLPSTEDFATALQQGEGKIVLIVYDLKSLDLWEKIDDARGRLMRTLHALAVGRDVCRQHVVLVFSDLHHQKWFDKECSLAATAVAAG